MSHIWAAMCGPFHCMSVDSCLRVQIVLEAGAAKSHINPFDLTRVWPHKDCPLIDVGVVELNHNPDNAPCMQGVALSS